MLHCIQIFIHPNLVPWTKRRVRCRNVLWTYVIWHSLHWHGNSNERRKNTDWNPGIDTLKILDNCRPFYCLCYNITKAHHTVWQIERFKRFLCRDFMIDMINKRSTVYLSILSRNSLVLHHEPPVRHASWDVHFMFLFPQQYAIP